MSIKTKLSYYILAFKSLSLFFYISIVKTDEILTNDKIFKQTIASLAIELS